MASATEPRRPPSRPRAPTSSRRPSSCRWAACAAPRAGAQRLDGRAAPPPPRARRARGRADVGSRRPDLRDGVRDHYRLDVLARRAAELQQADAQLGEVQRLLATRRGRRARPVPLVRRRAQPRRGLLLALRRRPARGGAPERARAVGAPSRLSRRSSGRHRASVRRSSTRSRGRPAPSAYAWPRDEPRVSPRTRRALRARVRRRGRALAAARGAAGAGAAPRPRIGRRRAARVRLPDLAGRQRAQPATSRARRSNPLSDSYIASIGAERCTCTPTSARTPRYGIPYAVVGPHQPRVPINFSEYGANPSPGPTRCRSNAPVEGAGEEGDRHVLVLQTHACKLYELYSAQRNGRRLGSRLGRRVQPAQQRAAPGRLDLGRRRRAADLPAARALPARCARAHRPRAARDRLAHAGAATSTRRRTSPRAAPTRACRRWACACA